MPLVHRLANTGTLQTTTYFDEYSRFGSGSLKFDGATGYLSFPSSSAFSFGTGDFTIETWVYPNNNSQNGGIFQISTSASGSSTAANQLSIQLFGGYWNFGTNAAFNQGNGSLTYSANVWYHVAITRTSGVIKYFINGIQVLSNVSDTTNYTGTYLLVGGFYVVPTYVLNGYLSNFRVVNGTALYTANFTPPTTTLTAVANTILLLPAYTNNPFKDYSSNNNTITVNGTVTANTLSPSLKTPSFTANNIIGQLDEYTISPLNPNNQVDPYFNQVSLLLHGDAANGSNNNTFLDSSTNNFTVTRNGNTTQGTNTPFSQDAGYWSNYFNGTTDYLGVPTNTALDLGSSNFTAEAWVYPAASITTAQFVIGSWNGTTDVSWWFGITGTNALAFVLSTTGTYNPSNDVHSANNVINPNAWNHIALVRNGNVYTMYANGVSVGTLTLSGALFSRPNNTQVGANSISQCFNGYVSNARIVVGTAVYTTTFTPPTTPLTAITNTSLLTCQSNYFKDNSSNNFTLTITGTPSVQPFSPFAPTSAYSTSVNGGSMYFDGTGDYLDAGISSVYTFGTNDFTVECWVYSPAGGDKGIFQQGTSLFPASTTNTVALGMNASNTWQIYAKNTNTNSTATRELNAWYHAALVRYSGTTTLYINGVAVITVSSDTTNYTGTYFGIGGIYGNYYFNGYISNLRVVKGTAVYTSAFTPPTTPLTAITNTSLLLSGTNAGIYDNAIKNNLETVGSAQVSTAVTKFGTGSVYCNGNGNYLTTPITPQLMLGTGDFTIECWINAPSGQTAYAGIFVIRTGGPTLEFTFNPSGTGIYVYSVAESTTNIIGNGWHHIAYVRYSGVGKVYVDGVVGTVSGANTSDYTFTSAAVVTIGVDSYNYSARPFNGYIDDLRVTKGIARYTANFTPPTQAFYNKGVGNITPSKVLSLSNTGIITVNGQFDEYTLSFGYVRNGLISYLDAAVTTSYSGSGTTFTDLSGLGNNGTLVGSPTFNPTSGGNIVLNGTSQYISAPLTKSGSMTFSIWATAINLTQPMLFVAGASLSGPDLFFNGGSIYWNTWDGAGNPFGLVPASATNGSFHNYVVVNDSVANTTKLYYDGTLLGTAAYRNAAVTTRYDIGGETSYYWQGSIASSMVYNKALSVNEISQNFNLFRNRFGI